MNHWIPQANLQLAWLWMLLGFTSGLLLGCFFHREEWLGGYGSLKRRMYRLAHISFFGLGAVNLFFFFTVQSLGQLQQGLLGAAGWTFIAGAVAMPVCCVLMAHYPRTRLSFGVPVLCLMAGGILTLALLQHKPGPAPALLTAH